MKTDDIDKIIAEALEAEKNKGRKGRVRGGRTANVDKIRKILNVVFMLGAIAAVIVYFAFPEQRTAFFVLGFGAMFLKIVEFGLRFLF